MPVQFSNSITIRRSVQDVFDFISRFENIPTWNYAIVETQKTSDGPVGVGSTYRQTRSLPSPSEETFRVTEFEPNRRLAIHGGLGPFEGALTYELRDEDGGTFLTNTADLQATGVLKLAAPIAEPRVRRAVAENLQKLKELLEHSS